MTAKYGLAEFVSHRPSLKRFSRIFGKEKKEAPTIVAASFGERLREAFVELGPTFIKFGQLMSDRKDLFPIEVLRELEKLQDEVPPFPYEEAVSIIEENLGQPIDSLFLRFDNEPDAAASLAQVHRAMLPTGKPVAVKIKRPGIDEQIEADIQIMHHLANFVDNNTSYFEIISAQEIVNEFEKQMLKELDFVQEFLTLRKFKEAYHDDKTVIVPNAYSEYSRRDILVMEYIHGKKVSEVIEENEERFDLKLLNLRNADFIMSQLFIKGFFHADPHPGNFLIVEGNIICYIDFGMVYSLRPYELENLNFMMVGLARMDPSLVARSLLRMGRAEGKVDLNSFESVVHDYIETHLDKPLEYIDVSYALISLLQIVVNFGIHIPPRFIYVAKVIGLLQSIGAGLDPEFQFIEYLRQYSPKIWANQLGSRRAGNKALTTGLNWSEMVLQTPELFIDLHRMIKEREFTLRTPQADEIRETYDKVGFRLVFGLVLSALLISSSLIVLADIEPQMYGIPIIGMIGYGAGALMGIGFLFAGIKKLFRWHYKE
ncbi:MAG: ABC1 kinase family protein [Spirochaetaceae bacterium]